MPVMTDRGLTPERLRGLLHYEPETGVFTWRVSPTNCVAAGSIAGTVDPNGYRLIQLDGVIRRAHRLAWFYVHECWPRDDVDHRFGVRDDNRIGELRELTRAENMHNRHSPSRNSLGLTGVRKHAGGKYEPRITVSGTPVYLGLFSTLEAAIEARCVAKARYHPTALGNAV